MSAQVLGQGSATRDNVRRAREEAVGLVYATPPPSPSAPVPREEAARRVHASRANARHDGLTTSDPPAFPENVSRVSRAFHARTYSVYMFMSDSSILAHEVILPNCM